MFLFPFSLTNVHIYAAWEHYNFFWSILQPSILYIASHIESTRQTETVDAMAQMSLCDMMAVEPETEDREQISATTGFEMMSRGCLFLVSSFGLSFRNSGFSANVDRGAIHACSSFSTFLRNDINSPQLSLNCVLPVVTIKVFMYYIKESVQVEWRHC